MPALKPETKATRDAAKLAEYLGKSVEDIKALQKPKQDAEEISLQAEAVIAYTQRPLEFREKQCKWCHQFFLTNYKAVGYCENRCRRKYLESLGILWNPTKSAGERWMGEPPLVIPPDAVPVVQQATCQKSIEIQDNVIPEPLPSIADTQNFSLGFFDLELDLPKFHLPREQ